MRLVSITILLCAFLAACGDDLAGTGSDNEPFDTFQDCWDDHHGGTDGFDVQTAIKICCLDHPIGGTKENIVCGATVDTCKTFVTANLSQSSASAAEIMTACEGYVSDRNK